MLAWHACYNLLISIRAQQGLNARTAVPRIENWRPVHLCERLLLFWSDRLQIASHMTLYPLLMWGSDGIVYLR